MASPKSADAFRTISEAASELDVPQHVLRHWEDVFGQIRPMRRAGGRRYYRPLDIDVLRGVRVLLYDERYTTRGVQKIFRENGVKYIAELGRLAAAGQPIELRPLVEEAEAGNGDPILDDGEGAPSPLAMSGEPLSPALRRKLAGLLTRLEMVQEALDEATLAIEAIDADADEDE
ncbi:MAG TPA: MerR family transcriptional regulator [Parvularculaceae bacterium]|nr:MerR family transcriptional regulator [Parvularculaceae bacterium]